MHGDAINKIQIVGRSTEQTLLVKKDLTDTYQSYINRTCILMRVEQTSYKILIRQ